MSYIIRVLALILIVQSANAENLITIKVLDSFSKEPVSYAVVTSKNQKKGIYTDKNGVVTINKDEYKGIIVLCTGYETKYSLLSDINDSLTIMLKKRNLILDEVTISPNNKEVTIPYFSKKPDYTFGSHISMELAVKINTLEKDSGRQKQLKQVKLKIKKANTNNPCRLHIYSVGVNGNPGEELLSDNIILSKKNISKKELTIDLSNYNIVLSSNEFFIGIEWLGTTKDMQNKISTNPRLAISHEKEEALTYTRTLSNNNWVLLKKGHPDFKSPPNMLVSITYK